MANPNKYDEVITDALMKKNKITSLDATYTLNSTKAKLN